MNASFVGEAENNAVQPLGYQYITTKKYHHPSPPTHNSLRLQTNAPIGTILLEDPHKANPLPNPRLLEPVLGDISDAAARLLQHTKVELAAATDIVRQDVSDRHEIIGAVGEEDLCRPISSRQHISLV